MTAPLNTKPNRLIRDDDDDAGDDDLMMPPIRDLEAPRVAVEPPRRGPALKPPENPRQPRKRRSTGGNGSYPGLKQVTAYIDPILYKKLRAMSLETERSMIDLMEQALTDHLKSYAAQRKFSAN